MKKFLLNRNVIKWSLKIDILFYALFTFTNTYALYKLFENTDNTFYAIVIATTAIANIISILALISVNTLVYKFFENKLND